MELTGSSLSSRGCGHKGLARKRRNERLESPKELQLEPATLRSVAHGSPGWYPLGTV